MAQLSFIGATDLAGLLTAADKRGLTYVQVLSKSRLGLGGDALKPTHYIDLGKEDIRPLESEASDGVEIATSPVRRTTRRSGRYYLEVQGTMIECVSLKEMLAQGLRAFQRVRPGTLEKLSEVRPRTKSIVARDPQELFTNPDLVQEYAEQLMDGWWYGTNNSSNETLTWLKRGAEIAGLVWGKDISTSLG